MNMQKLFITVVLMQGVMFANEAKKGSHNQSLTQQATLSNSHHSVASGDSLHSTVVSVLNYPRAAVLHHGVGAITFGASDLTITGYGVHTLGSTGLGITPKIGVPATVNGQAPSGLHTPTETAGTYTTPHMLFNGTVSGAGTTAPVLTISEDVIVSGDMKLRNMSLALASGATLTVNGTLEIDGVSGDLASNSFLSVPAGTTIMANNIVVRNLNSAASGAAIINILGTVTATGDILIDGNTSTDEVVVSLGATAVVTGQNITFSNNVTTEVDSDAVELLSGGVITATRSLIFYLNTGGTTSGIGVSIANSDTGILAKEVIIEVGAAGSGENDYITAAGQPQDYFDGGGDLEAIYVFTRTAGATITYFVP